MYGISDGEVTAVDDITVIDVVGNCFYTGGYPAILCSPSVKPNTLLLLVGTSGLIFTLCVSYM